MLIFVSINALSGGNTDGSRTGSNVDRRLAIVTRAIWTRLDVVPWPRRTTAAITHTRHTDVVPIPPRPLPYRYTSAHRHRLPNTDSRAPPPPSPPPPPRPWLQCADRPLPSTTHRAAESSVLPRPARPYGGPCPVTLCDWVIVMRCRLWQVIFPVVGP